MASTGYCLGEEDQMEKTPPCQYGPSRGTGLFSPTPTIFFSESLETIMAQILSLLNPPPPPPPLFANTKIIFLCCSMI